MAGKVGQDLPVGRGKEILNKVTPHVFLYQSTHIWLICMGNVGKYALVSGNDARLEEMCSYFLDEFRDEWLVYLFEICAS